MSCKKYSKCSMQSVSPKGSSVNEYTEYLYRPLFMSQIWANIQVNETPARLNFDFGNEKLWKPFFNRSNPALGLASVQVNEFLKPGHLFANYELLVQVL